MTKFTCVCVLAVLLLATAQALPRTAKGVEVRLRMKGANDEATIEAEFRARTEPKSPMFRKHMSLKELTALVAAPEGAIAAAKSWLVAHGARSVKVMATRDYVVGVFASRGAVVRAFKASLVDKAGKRKSELAVPKELLASVRAVHVPSGFHAVPHKTHAKKGDLFGPRQVQTPPAVRTRYNMPSQNKYSMMPQLATYSQAVAEFEGENFLMSDITMFNAIWGAPAPKVMVEGPNVPTQGSGQGLHAEGALDMEYLNALNVNTTTYWVAKTEFDFVGIGERLLTITPPPSVFSISYGAQEADFTAEFMTSSSAEFRKLGMMGISVMVASGDNGDCTRNFITPDPSFPATSPYVTAVGATYAHDAAGEEIGWEYSGGGLSNTFTRPLYQNATVNAYLANTTDLPPPGWFPPNGRAIPDVSALGSHFNITVQGAWELVDGTSCAAPSFTSVISLINMERMSQGKPSLGFLNPTLYTLGKVGFDVTRGDNKNICLVGFPARVGWDAVTGLGTPDYEYLRQNL